MEEADATRRQGWAHRSRHERRTSLAVLKDSVGGEWPYRRSTSQTKSQFEAKSSRWLKPAWRTRRDEASRPASVQGRSHPSSLAIDSNHRLRAPPIAIAFDVALPYMLHGRQCQKVGSTEGNCTWAGGVSQLMPAHVSTYALASCAKP